MLRHAMVFDKNSLEILFNPRSHEINDKGKHVYLRDWRFYKNKYDTYTWGSN